MEFAKIALSRLTDIMTRFKVKLTEATIETMVQSCREQFRKQILPFFINDGRKWVVEVGIPQGFPGVEERRLEFSDEIVLECFQPSMRSIRKLVIASILNLYYAGSLASVSVFHFSNTLVNHLADKCLTARPVSWSVCLIKIPL